MSISTIGKFIGTLLPLPTMQQTTDVLKTTTKIGALISNIYFDCQLREKNPNSIQRLFTGPNMILGAASFYFTRLTPLFYLFTAVNTLIFVYAKAMDDPTMEKMKEQIVSKIPDFITNLFNKQIDNQLIYYPNGENK